MCTYAHFNAGINQNWKFCVQKLLSLSNSYIVHTFTKPGWIIIPQHFIDVKLTQYMVIYLTVGTFSAKLMKSTFEGVTKVSDYHAKLLGTAAYIHRHWSTGSS